MNINDFQKGKRDEYRVSQSDITIKEGWNSRFVNFNPGDDDDMALARSIAVEGVKLPLVCYMEGDLLMLEDGHRRLCALRHAVEHLGVDPESLVAVRMTDRNAPAKERLYSQITLNGSKPLAPLELAMHLGKLIAEGETHKTIAERIGRTPQYVGQLLTLAQAPAEVVEMVKEGAVSATLAVETLKEEGEGAGETLKEAMKTAAESGKTRVTRKHVAKQIADKAVTTKALRDAFSQGVSKVVRKADVVTISMPREKADAFLSLIGFTDELI